MSKPQTSMVILGGGPGGYEAALVAAQLGARVTVVDSDGLGGACVLTDCVPSKTLIATSETMGLLRGSASLGIEIPGAGGAGNGGAGPAAAAAGPGPGGTPGERDWIDAPRLYGRVKALAQAQSADVGARLAAEGVEVVTGRGRLTRRTRPARLAGAHAVVVGDREIVADVVLIATGGLPRVMPSAEPDGKRILTWRQLYDLDELPAELIVVGSGVTGAEFASAYQALGSQVTLISSRERVLPQEDADAAVVVEDVFRRRGMTVLSRSRAAAVRREGGGVLVTLTDGRAVRGTHCLLTVGVGAGHRRHRPGRGRRRARRPRVHRGGQGVTDLRAGRVRGRRLHRGADARLGRGDAGPDRDVARAGRGGPAAAAGPRRGDDLHRAGDRHRRRGPRR